MKKKIYISGKMGEATLSDEVVAKFRQAEERMQKHGWEVINPASEGYQKEIGEQVEATRKYREFLGEKVQEYNLWLLYDMYLIATCNAIYLLKDWANSPGAKAEYMFAVACGLEIIFE